ncbi:zinc-binding dehydrogenase [Galactobacter caseinivorans]|uniref:NADPH:quinone oxidoreductase n=1 Tax=Galactobacter caseinivorans TaxID=2676123 RepID=A0A496PIW8_9MICC|nr:zinc-binding dehydrogenase [Galactobacter caseinivorans]RKW70434.1 NADPH:quinone oxidoreductase [Galactobacter caseinivorans]
MRALRQHQFGVPAEVLVVEDVPTPTAGPGQALVRTVLSPVHNHDIWTVTGNYGFKPEMPAAAGTEALGVIEALGEGVTGLEVGQRVIAGGVFGVWAELFVAPAATLIPVPDAIEDEAAAQLVSMPFSALSLVNFLGVKEGEWLIQNAANGAVGRLVAQFAAARGINVVGLVRRVDGVAELAEQGINRIVATDSEGWQEQVQQITGGAPIPVAVDSVGGQASADLLSALAENGTLVSFGAMGSPVMQIPSGPVIFKQATIKGFWGSKVSQDMAPEEKAALMGEIFRRVAAGEVTLPVSGTFGLEDVASAIASNFEAGRVGKVLLKP